MHSSDIQGGGSVSKTKSTQQQNEEVFTKTIDLMWTQAQSLFGEDASQVICDAVSSDNPTDYVRDYLPNALSSAS